MTEIDEINFLFNDLDEIYNQPLLSAPNGDFMCPVCRRTYVKKDRLITHLNKRDCHSYTALFQHKAPEREFYRIYKELCALQNKRIATMAKFRTTGMYTSLAKTYVFCLNNNIILGEYIEWVVNTSTQNIPKTIADSARDSKLTKFMDWRRDNRRYELCTDFFLLNESKLKSDYNWTIRCLERGDISKDFFFDHLSDIISELSSNQMERLELLL